MKNVTLQNAGITKSGKHIYFVIFPSGTVKQVQSKDVPSVSSQLKNKGYSVTVKNEIN